MEIIGIAALFVPIVVLAMRQKKWYLYLLIAFFPILPEQFSVRLHPSLPLLTVSRVLIVLVAVIWVVKRRNTIKKAVPISILIFVGVNLLLSLIHLPSDIDEINRIISTLAEHALVVVMVADLVESREEFERCIDFYIWGSCAVAVVGIVQTVFQYNLAQGLYWTETATSYILSDRMGLTRAYGTFNAISYGCYSAFMAILIYYRLAQTKQHRYSIAFALNEVALIATFTRSAWLCIAAVFVILFFTKPRKMLSTVWVSAVLVIALCLGLSIIQPKFGDAVVETGKSSVITIMKVLPDSWFQQGGADTKPISGTDPTEVPNPTEEPTTPPVERPMFELSDAFGGNANDPAYSRTFQWSAVRHMLQDGSFVLGYGYNALPQGQLRYMHKAWGDKWVVATFLDVGMVGMLAEGGLIGFLAWMALLGYIVVQSVRRRTRKKVFDFYKMSILLVLLYLLLNVLASFIYPGTVWIFIGLFYAYKKLEHRGIMSEAADQSDAHWRF